MSWEPNKSEQLVLEELKRYEADFRSKIDNEWPEELGFAEAKANFCATFRMHLLRRFAEL